MAVVAPVGLVYGGLSDESIHELQRIHDEFGAILPETVVTIAANPASPLHEHFTWDDGEAAHQFRLHQARQVVAKVRVSISNLPDVRVRAFVSIGMDSGREYRRTTDLLGSPITIEQYRRHVMGELQKLQRKLTSFDEFAEAARAIGVAIERLG